MQKPTMTPREQLDEARKFPKDTAGLASSAGMAVSARQVGRAPMPPRKRNELNLGEGARLKKAMRYDYDEED